MTNAESVLKRPSRMENGQSDADQFRADFKLWKRASGCLQQLRIATGLPIILPKHDGEMLL
jgi:hypothetical protein